MTLDDLLARYDAVLFATGAVKDKPLNLPGADLDGVSSACIRKFPLYTRLIPIASPAFSSVL